jgi:hypothetical protein
MFQDGFHDYRPGTQVDSGRDMTTRNGMWARWVTLQGAPRAFLAVRTRRGEPLAPLLVGPQRGGDPYPLIQQIRAQGRLTRTPIAWVYSL